MGDGADYFISAGIDQWSDSDYGYEQRVAEYGERTRLRNGTTQHLNVVSSGHHRTKLRACKYCGKGRLHWLVTHDGYRLFDYDTKNMHRCGEGRRR